MKADALLVNFCTGIEKLYGKQFLTCNMHLHCHLHSVLLDYGPVFGFWLFSFERYNGQLGSTLTTIVPWKFSFARLLKGAFSNAICRKSANHLPRGIFANLQ